jgi:hypothetical protein
MSGVEIPASVVAAITLRKGKRVGIDGTHGSGKTTLAKAVAAELHFPLFSLDDYLDRQQGGFLEFLDYRRLSRDLAAADRFVLEGVCLLDAVKRADVELDCLVYVKRLRHGLWADERELEIEEPLEEFLEKERLTAMICGDDEPVTDLGLDEEVIRYHYVQRPHKRADITFARRDEH